MIVCGAASRKISHSRVCEEEHLYFMKKGSALIIATVGVKNVQNYTKLSDEEITEVFEDNPRKLNSSEKQKTRWHKKCLCLVEIENIQTIIIPLFVFFLLH